jgi:hypothetical protein
MDPIELVNKPSSMRESPDPALDGCLAWCSEVKSDLLVKE